jgi:diguanylate cyclase (GGDEF)-like protein
MKTKETESRLTPIQVEKVLSQNAAALAAEQKPLGVLIVEDSSEIRDMEALLVDSMGYHTYTATTGKEALVQLRKHAPDLVLLDLMMPEMDGFEFCQVVQSDPTLPKPHIIITSARDALEDRVRGLELGAADYLIKPFSLTELKARIKAGERIIRYQKMLEDQQALLEQLAREDKLTGLYNRRYFEERAQEEFLRAQRYNRPLTFLLGDLDHFKKINDRYGHAKGDLVLKKVSEMLLLHCRRSDVVARYGGEEFTVLLPETVPDDARKVAERLCTAVRTLSFPHPSGPMSVTISFGLSSLAEEGVHNLHDLIDQADKALYAAKRKGRDRVECWPVEASASSRFSPQEEKK